MAGFKTAYLQREIILDAKVTTECKVGDCVKIVPANGETPASMAKSSFADATHIVAQSDMTLEYGHVPVEKMDWKYVPTVAQSSTVKKVAVFAIMDKNDIILDNDGQDVV